MTIAKTWPAYRNKCYGSDMLTDAFIAFWFFLPAACANTTPTVTSRLPYLKDWNAPVDGGKSWRGQRLLGDHKT